MEGNCKECPMNELDEWVPYLKDFLNLDEASRDPDKMVWSDYSFRKVVSVCYRIFQEVNNECVQCQDYKEDLHEIRRLLIGVSCEIAKIDKIDRKEGRKMLDISDKERNAFNFLLERGGLEIDWRGEDYQFVVSPSAILEKGGHGFYHVTKFQKLSLLALIGSVGNKKIYTLSRTTERGEEFSKFWQSLPTEEKITFFGRVKEKFSLNGKVKIVGVGENDLPGPEPGIVETDVPKAEADTKMAMVFNLPNSEMSFKSQLPAGQGKSLAKLLEEFTPLFSSVKSEVHLENGLLRVNLEALIKKEVIKKEILVFCDVLKIVAEAMEGEGDGS